MNIFPASTALLAIIISLRFWLAFLSSYLTYTELTKNDSSKLTSHISSLPLPGSCMHEALLLVVTLRRLHSDPAQQQHSRVSPKKRLNSISEFPPLVQYLTRFICEGIHVSFGEKTLHWLGLTHIFESRMSACLAFPNKIYATCYGDNLRLPPSSPPSSGVDMLMRGVENLAFLTNTPHGWM